jgi:hypothetical protein
MLRSLQKVAWVAAAACVGVTAARAASPAPGCFAEWQVANAAAFPPRSDIGLVTFGGQLLLIGGGNYSQDYTVWNDAWTSADGIEWALLTSGTAFSPRAYHALVVVGGPQQETLVLAGGGRCDGNFSVYSSMCTSFSWQSDVWTSTDAVHWQLVRSNGTCDGAWSPRGGHTMSVLPGANVLVLTGGLDNERQYNDTWVSSDGGATWWLATQGPWAGRSFHQAAVHGAALYITGGANFTARFDDVWRLNVASDGSSTSGVQGAAFSWSLVQPAGPRWSARTAHAVVAAGATLLLVAGMLSDMQVATTDVWASNDGGAANWTLVTPAGGFPARSFHAMAALQLPLPVPQSLPGLDVGCASQPAHAANVTRLVLLAGFRLDDAPDPPLPFTYVYYGDVWTTDCVLN